MYNIFRWVTIIIVSTIMVKIFMNIVERYGIKFTDVFEDIWQKLKR
ncbi:MAG: hypothetical protein PHV60_07920 [bacterium]|nr:hypothetical protein [bacterium]